mgnify:CR=1 FL=1
MTLDAQIEGILFFKGEPISIGALSKLLSVNEDEVIQGLELLENRLAERGLALVRKDDEVVLAVRKELSNILEDLRKDELQKELTKASLETLSITLYKNGATRGEIDYIRGVNSSFILRNLQIRGLVERVTDPNDSRRYVYKPTFETLQYLGIQKISDLPDFEKVEEELARAFTAERAEESASKKDATEQEDQHVQTS